MSQKPDTTLVFGINQKRNIEVNVCRHIIKESKSEKLLGLIISNDLKWNNYLYGEKWRDKKEDNFKGLIPKLSQNVGLLKKIRKRMPEETFKMVSSGMFTSLVSYCIEVFGNNWGLDTMDEAERRSISFTKKDCAKLQTLQNTVLKLQTGLPRDYPIKDLLLKT